MSHSVHMAEVAVGAVNELARQGGQAVIAHPHGFMANGAGLVQAAAAVAPGVVAAASAGTAAIVTTVTPIVVALAPLAVVAGIGYGCYKLFKFLDA